MTWGVCSYFFLLLNIAVNRRCLNCSFGLVFTIRMVEKCVWFCIVICKSSEGPNIRNRFAMHFICLVAWWLFCSHETDQRFIGCYQSNCISFTDLFQVHKWILNLNQNIVRDNSKLFRLKRNIALGKQKKCSHENFHHISSRMAVWFFS